MLPVAATLSTTHKQFRAKNCIDGVTKGNIKNLCHSKRERAPWLALDFGKETKVSVEKVVLFNREDYYRGRATWTRTKNVQIRLSNDFPLWFKDGKLLGTFKGPATRGQKVEIQSTIGWEKMFGRYLIIQINFGNWPNYLNLKEVFAVGVSQKKNASSRKVREGKVEILQKWFVHSSLVCITSWIPATVH